MKHLILPLLTVLFFTSGVKAQTNTNSMMTSRNGVIERWLLSLEFNSWVEKLSITSSSGGSQDSKASYYGVGLGAEKNFYYSNWGWGLGGGLASGSAVGGDKNVALKYFEARVPWTALRLTPRIFWRLGPKVDFGFDFSTYYKKIDWPSGATGDMTVQSGSKLITGGFIDLRARISSSFEYIQSFGMVYKDETMYWRVGIAYRM